MTVLVCGGRNFGNRWWLYTALDALHDWKPIDVLIHGDARGADHLAGEWARDRKVPCRRYPADWEKHGKSAGPRRNQQMLDEGRPDLVMAFPGGAGTRDMVTRAKRAGIRVDEQF